MRASASRVLLVVVLGVGTFAALAVYADVSLLTARLAGFAWIAFIAAVGLALVNYALRIARWQLLLRATGIELPAGTSVLVFLSGFAMAITPGRVGELIKSYLLRELCGTPVTQSAPIVVAERVIDLLALLVIALVGLVVYGIGGAVVVAGGVLLGVGFLALAWQRLGRGLIALATAPRLLRRWRAPLEAFHRNLVSLLGPGLLARSSALTIAAWSAECVGFALIVSAFPGVDAPLGLTTVIYATTLIAGAVSFLPGGLGVTEATMTLLLVEAVRGIDEPTAAASTMLMRVGTFWFSVLLGILALAALRRRITAQR